MSGIRFSPLRRALRRLRPEKCEFVSRRLLFLPLISAAILLGSCDNFGFPNAFSSLQEENFSSGPAGAAREDVTIEGFTLTNALYLIDTDFSMDKGFIESHDRPTVAVEDGALHMYGTDPGCETVAHFGKNSFISYRMKVENQNGDVQMSFFWDNNEGNDYQQNVNIPPAASISWDTRVNGSTVDSGGTSTTVSEGLWHEIDVLLYEGQFSFYFNGSKIIDTALHPDLILKGPMFLLSFDSNYYIDDLKIITFDSLE